MAVSAYGRRRRANEPPFPETPEGIAAFAAAAQARWTSERALRAKDAKRQQVRHNEHEITIPEGYENRAFPIYAGKAAEKLDRGITYLTDDDAVQVTVAKLGTKEAPKKRAETVQNALFGFLELTDEQYSDYYKANAEDILNASRVFNLVLPAEDAWSLPRPDDTLIASVEDDPDAAKEAADEYEAEAEAHKRTHPPICIRTVPAMTVIYEPDHYDNPVCAWQYEMLGVRSVLRTWQDEHGKPKAWELYRAVCKDQKLPDPGARDWEGDIDPEITDDNQVCIVHYADDQWYQVAVLSDTTFDDNTGDWRTSVTREGTTDAIIWSSRHEMGMCPYVLGKGRTTTSRDPVRKWHGFLDPIVWTPAGDEDSPANLSLCEALDHVLTQAGSTARQIGWSAPVVERGESPVMNSLPGTQDRKPAQVLEEGKLNYLQPGERVVAPTLMDAAGAQAVERTIDRLLHEIDLKTFPAVSYGASSGKSGYDTAQMLGSASQVIEPFRLGLGTFYANVCNAVLAAGRVVNRRTGEPIVVRYLNDESALSWITLTEELLAESWVVQCEVTPQPLGGQLAWIETLEKMYVYGIISQEEKMTLARNRNPSRTKEQRMVEALEQGQAAQQITEQYFAQQVAGSLLNPRVPSLPGAPRISGALVAAGQQWGVDEALQLGPTAMAPGAGTMGAPGTLGLPNMTPFQGAPMNPPTPNGGGRPAGLPPTVPGGELATLAETAGRFG